MVDNYKDLDVWRLSIELVDDIYQITEAFPKKEQYRLTDQLCRAAISIASNIAEGSKRHTTKEYIRFVGIAQGSLAEAETQIIIAQRLNYITDITSSTLLTKVTVLGKKLHGLASALQRKIDCNSLSHPTTATTTAT